MMPPSKPICLPPAPLNGGPLDTAPAKVGDWIWQPKVDDWRAVIHTPSRTVWNQYGKASTITDKFRTALDHLFDAYSNRSQAGFQPAEWLDVGMMENRNDLMRGCIIVLDLIEPDSSFMDRRAALRSMFPLLPFDVSRLLDETGGQIRNSVYLINQWGGDIEPIKLYEWLKQENELIGHKFYEGLVAKRVTSAYPFSQTSKAKFPDWIKHRFDQ